MGEPGLGATALRARGVSKCYQLYDRPAHRLWQLLWRGRRRYYREFWALQNVDLDVRAGEAVGIIGRNGSGKSTLLQVLCGTVTPTNGQVQVEGRVAALLELGAGFNPEFSGRENAQLNAAMLGLSRAEIDEGLEQIIEFAELRDFIDQPVKTYSSGMYVRLAFSVAVHVSPQILVVDEALAVGDARFQLKCIRKMEEFRERGVTVLFVSHADEHIRRFCQRAVWLDQGRVRAEGEVNEVVDRYRDYLARLDALARLAPARTQVAAEAAPAPAGMPARILAVTPSANEAAPFEPYSVTVEYEIHEPHIEDFLVGVAIYDAGRTYVFGPNTHLERVAVPAERGVHRVRYLIPRLPLLAREYLIDVGIFSKAGLVGLDYRAAAATLTVRSGYISEGLVYIDHRWEVEQ